MQYMDMQCTVIWTAVLTTNHLGSDDLGLHFVYRFWTCFRICSVDLFILGFGFILAIFVVVSTVVRRTSAIDCVVKWLLFVECYVRL